MVHPFDIGHLRTTLEAVADTDQAAPMASYMKNQFTFLGVTAPERRRAIKAVIAHAKGAEPAEVMAFADSCWAEPEREFQYVAADALRAAAPRLSAADLPAIRRLIATKSWWDTVDLLAAWVVGPVVQAAPELAADMDAWIDDADIWIGAIHRWPAAAPC